jgi:plastocyanin
VITPRRRIRIAVAALAILSLAAACGGEESVGDESLLEGTEGEEGLRLGETTTTTTTAPAADAPTETTAPQATTAPPTTVAAAPSVVVNIGSDTTAGGQFQPRVAQVPSGAIVRFVNNDSVARSVVADAGSFDSGPIAPGASWDWVAGGAGTYNYSDGTRPYAVGSVEVV